MGRRAPYRLGRLRTDVAHPQAESSVEPAKHVTPWLVAGLVLLLSSTSISLLLPELADPESAEMFDLVSYASLAIYLPLGSLLLFVGVRRAYRNPPESFTPRRTHTILVGVLGTVLLLVALTSAVEPGGTSNTSLFSAALLGLISASALFVVLLRLRRSPLAKSATAAINICWAPIVPFGTALFIWWLVSLRKHE